MPPRHAPVPRAPHTAPLSGTPLLWTVQWAWPGAGRCPRLSIRVVRPLSRVSPGCRLPLMSPAVILDTHLASGCSLPLRPCPSRARAPSPPGLGSPMLCTLPSAEVDTPARWQPHRRALPATSSGGWGAATSPQPPPGDSTNRHPCQGHFVGWTSLSVPSAPPSPQPLVTVQPLRPRHGTPPLRAPPPPLPSQAKSLHRPPGWPRSSPEPHRPHLGVTRNGWCPLLASVSPPRLCVQNTKPPTPRLPPAPGSGAVSVLSPGAARTVRVRVSGLRPPAERGLRQGRDFVLRAVTLAGVPEFCRPMSHTAGAQRGPGQLIAQLLVPATLCSQRGRP